MAADVNTASHQGGNASYPEGLAAARLLPFTNHDSSPERVSCDDEGRSTSCPFALVTVVFIVSV